MFMLWFGVYKNSSNIYLGALLGTVQGDSTRVMVQRQNSLSYLRNKSCLSGSSFTCKIYCIVALLAHLFLFCPFHNSKENHSRLSSLTRHKAKKEMEESICSC